MSTANLLETVRADFKRGELDSAGRKMAKFFRAKFKFDVARVEIRNDGYSLNSVNGFVYLKGVKNSASNKLFFKFHQEEGEGDTIKEYYRGQLLKQNGYPVDVPLYASGEVGEQVLVYAESKNPRLADLSLQIEQAGCPENDVKRVAEAQRRLDELVLDRYKATLHVAKQPDLLPEPILQLFFWRLVDHHAETSAPKIDGKIIPGGRWKKFYSGTNWALPGLAQAIPFERLAQKKWVINGVEYQSTFEELFQRAYRLMNPANVAEYPAVIAHGDAHNANVWFCEQPNAPAELVFFDPAFAGEHIPALLAEVKATFHNIFAHQEWLYQPKLADRRLCISAELEGDKITVSHEWKLNALRQAFLDSKAQVFWQPWLAHLKRQQMLTTDWRSYLRASLFCCPTLVMNLRAEADTHTQKTSLLGLSIAMMLGSEPQAGQGDVITQFLDSIAP